MDGPHPVVAYRGFLPFGRFFFRQGFAIRQPYRILDRHQMEARLADRIIERGATVQAAICEFIDREREVSEAVLDLRVHGPSRLSQRLPG